MARSFLSRYRRFVRLRNEPNDINGIDASGIARKLWMQTRPQRAAGLLVHRRHAAADAAVPERSDPKLGLRLTRRRADAKKQRSAAPAVS
jgi:hypothetical protein